MKIKVVTGATLYDSTRNVLKTIDVKDVFTPYFVVVPDRFTLQAEKMLFEELQIRSTFNINVVGLSSLAGKALKGEVEEINSLEGVLLIQRLLLEMGDKLQYFTRSTPELCQEIYKNIQQMKSSCISFQNINTSAKSSALSKKIADIKLLYEQYELSRGEKLDSDDVISAFAEKIQEKKLYEGSVFLFVGFDSFTAANYSIISALTKSVKEIRFALSKPVSISNAFIYEGDMLEKLKRLANENNVDLEVSSPSLTMSKEREGLASNLFGRSVQPVCVEDFCYIACSPSIKEEVLFVAKSIKKLLTEGARFKDFQIVCPSLEKYSQEIEICFSKFGIKAYVDSSTLFSETILARFIKKCFESVQKGFKKEDVLFFLSSRLLDFENRESLVAFVNEKNISGRDKFSYYVAKENSIFSVLLSMKENATYKEYSSIAKEISVLLEEKILAFANQEIEKGYAQQGSFDLQSMEALNETLDALSKFDLTVSLKDFLSMLSTALDSKEISSLPSFCDQVFVGESAKSYFGKSKYMFVLGANAGVLPTNSNDDGLFTDAEIESSCFKQKLEPTIKMINKRNRFKFFSALCEAEERLTVSYLGFNEEGQKQEKAYFINSLMQIFGQQNILLTNNLIVEDMDGLLFSLGLSSEAKKEIYKLKENNSSFTASVKKACDFKDGEKLNRSKLDPSLAEELFFKNRTARVTQIEKFYDCPFKQFVDNGLRPVEKKYALVRPNIYGTLMHDVLEAFVKKYALDLGSVTRDEIKMFLKENLSKFFDEDLIEFLPDKNLFVKEVFSNALKLCERVVYEAKNSSFVPKYFEKDLKKDALKVDNISLVGKVDRVDEFENSFRVIDYKTGNISQNILSSLYYGKKLQLFLYGSGLKKELEKDFVGAFYFDAKISYSKNNATILKGAIEPREEILYALDKRLCDEDYVKSDIVQAEKNASGVFKKALGQPRLEELEKYALAISKDAIAGMKAGVTEPLPDKDSCTYCPYRAICLHEIDEECRTTQTASEYFSKKEEQ